MLHADIILRSEETIEGRGLIARATIRAGEVVSQLEPGQPRTRISDLLKLPQAEQDRLMHFCYQCDEAHIVCEEGIEKYMNHSCDPNTWWADDNTMTASRDISAGEEITYDYATTEVDVPFRMVCLCGSANCRGEITADDHRDPAWQARFGANLPAHTRRAIARAATGG